MDKVFCPKCDSKSIKITATEIMKIIYICLECGECFEKEPSVQLRMDFNA